MITRRVWRALLDPPGVHPLFHRIVLLPPSVPRHYFTLANAIVNLVLGVGSHLPTLLLLLMPLILLILGVAYGLDCALRISTAIARSHEDDTYALLALTPGGAIEASWALCASTLYRNRDFSRLRATVNGTLIVGLVLTPVIALFSILFATGLTGRFLTMLDVFTNFVNLLTVLAVLYLEYVQSTVQGVLVGMLIPTYVQNRLDANIFALLTFLLLQIAVYAAFLLLGFTLLPILLDSLALDIGWVTMLLAALRVGLFYGIREAVIAGVWWRLMTRLNTSLSEFTLVSRPMRS
ncbi:MAG: hypothetical protein H6672_04405 [Anaerolineaceae bacterium]|nr:hypothetical protein [Anaerolineaceae bacterium]